MIKYTKNITNKLKSMEFKFDYELDSKGKVFSEVWSKGIIEVSIDHDIKEVMVSIINDDAIQLNTLYELQTLDKLINKK